MKDAIADFNIPTISSTNSSSSFKRFTEDGEGVAYYWKMLSLASPKGKLIEGIGSKIGADELTFSFCFDFGMLFC